MAKEQQLKRANKSKSPEIKKEKVKKEPKVKRESIGNELKPGQKHPTPTPGFGDRVFYESLFRQRPDSIMAQEWCIAYGVLPVEEASALHSQLLAYKKKGGVLTMISPVKSSPVEPQTKKRKTGTGKKRKSDDVSIDVGLQISGGEGIGTALF